MISSLMFHTMVVDQLVDHPDLKESYFFMPNLTHICWLNGNVNFPFFLLTHDEAGKLILEP